VRGNVHSSIGFFRHWSRFGDPAEVPHRGVLGGRLSGGDEAHGVLVGIR
jgi:hypothetical protein